jgi:hypothetical protein
VPSVLATIRRDPSAILLFTQLAGLLLYPFMEGREVGRALFGIFGIAILGLVLLAVRNSPWLTWVAVLFGIPATILLLIQAATRSDGLAPYSSALEAVLYLYAAGALITYMLADHEITRDELFAVGAMFARGLVMIEEIAGLAYVAMLVSRLVTLMVARRATDA